MEQRAEDGGRKKNEKALEEVKNSSRKDSCCDDEKYFCRCKKSRVAATTVLRRCNKRKRVSFRCCWLTNSSFAPLLPCSSPDASAVLCPLYRVRAYLSRWQRATSGLTPLVPRMRTRIRRTRRPGSSEHPGLRRTICCQIALFRLPVLNTLPSVHLSCR